MKQGSDEALWWEKTEHKNLQDFPLKKYLFHNDSLWQWRQNMLKVEKKSPRIWICFDLRQISARKSTAYKNWSWLCWHISVMLRAFSKPGIRQELKNYFCFNKQNNARHFSYLKSTLCEKN